VWQTWGPGSTSAGTQDYAPIVAEIRARQPQAKILLVAPMPRGQWDRDRQRQIAADHAATLAGLVDNATVFYMNIGERFFFPNGSFNQAMWRSEPLVGVGDVGTQTAAFEVWAQELQPWLDRFVR
jgi:hypothetical protein